MSSEPRHDATVNRILTRVQAEVSAGRKWRAREILRGSIRTHATDPRILREYGRILEDLGDRVEAGKYLFLSGDRGPDAEPAIQIFLERHSKGQLGDLVRQFPRGIRAADLAALPAVVSRDLEALGLPKHGRRAPDSMVERAVPKQSIGDYAALIGCASAGFVLLAALILGLGVIMDWIVTLVGS